MKFIWIFFSITLFLSCQPKEENNTTQSNDIVENEVKPIDINEFKEYFQNATLSDEYFHIHHYKWATENNDFKGLSIAPKIIKQYVDSTIFKINKIVKKETQNFMSAPHRKQ